MDISNFTDEQMEEIDKKIKIKTDEEHQEFMKFLEQGKCYICKNDFDHFSETEPCFHWLLRPQNIDKKYFQKVFDKFGYYKINSFLRWLANSEIPFKNINDLVEERDSKKFIEETIKYKQFEWSFSCSENDLLGHAERVMGNNPHFHFQMKINDKIFITYSDFHINFDQEDLWTIDVIKGKYNNLRHNYMYGAGMQGAIDRISPKDLIDNMVTVDNELDATWGMGTVLMAEEGKTISGDEIANIFEKSKQTKQPFAKLAKNIINVKSMQVMIEPGPGVSPIAGRKKKGKNKK